MLRESGSFRTVSYDGRLEAELFRELDDPHRGEFLRSRSDAEGAWVLAQMEGDDATGARWSSAPSANAACSRFSPARSAARIRGLMRYHAASAGGIMSPDFSASTSSGQPATPAPRASAVIAPKT